MAIIRGGNVIGGAGRRLSVIRATLTIATDFVDLGGADGISQPGAVFQIPAGANVVYSRCTVNVACTGDVSAVITIGDGSDVDRYHTGTPSVFTTGDKDMGAPSGTKYHTSQISPTITISSAADFTNVNPAGQITVEIWFYQSA